MKEARLWVTPATPWIKIPLSLEKFPYYWLAGKDCFYACRSEQSPPSSWDVFKVSLEGSISRVETLNLKGFLKIQYGNLFIKKVDISTPVPVGHSTSWEEVLLEELPSWDSIPGSWTWNWQREYEVISPDGISHEIYNPPVGVFRNEVVEKIESSMLEELVGPYHLIESDHKIWCRNLFVSGIASSEKPLEEQFFPLPVNLTTPGTFLYHRGRLYTVSFEEDSLKLCRSGVLQ